jgi:catalase
LCQTDEETACLLPPSAIAPDSATTERNLLFLPDLLPVGIEPADPMIQFRDKAYPISFDRRHALETEK